MTDILREAKRLYGLGLGVHWIRPNSKAPVKANWATPQRDDWDTVKRDYAEGYGLGVRLGGASRLEDGFFLANIDIDIKSSKKRHKKEALSVVRERFPGVLKTAPVVRTSYGFRVFVKTRKPLPSGKVTASSDICKVLMPTAPVTKQQEKAMADGVMTADELKRGMRVRPAWEVEFMSVGKQVVLPPSIHPDTGRAYSWLRELKALTEIPVVRTEQVSFGAARKLRDGGKNAPPFEAVDVDLVTSTRLSEKMVGVILNGDDVDDRSAAALGACIAMVRAKYTDNEILSVLTDRGNFLGEIGYDHRQTENRNAAAAWVRDYCLAPAKQEVSAAAAFADECIATPVLDAEGAERQAEKLLGKGPGAGPNSDPRWKEYFDCGGKDGTGAPKPTLKNTLWAIENAAGQAVFRKNLFTGREHYGSGAPWQGAIAGKGIEDIDAVNIKSWLAAAFEFEPAVGVVFEAIATLADRNTYHPIRDWFEALPEWDGVPRIESWLALHFGARGDSGYLGQVLRKWMVGAVTRIYQPGAKFDWMPILEGKQGTGKSSFASILMGDDFFTDWLPPLTDKDAALGLQGKWCVEFAELAALRRNELETTKAFITRRVDCVRPPYGRKTLELARQTVFLGSTNSDCYLRDDTGNRRFAPVEVGRLNFRQLERDREQLWAEAYFIFRNGFESTLELEDDAVRAAHTIREEKMVPDETVFFEHALERFITSEMAKKCTDRFDFSRFQASTLFMGLGPFSDQQQSGKNYLLVSKLLRSWGGTRKIIRGTRVWDISKTAVFGRLASLHPISHPPEFS